jgi:hypothetical protein
MSPLEMARAQGAAGAKKPASAEAAPAAKLQAAAPATGGKPLSPLELARMHERRAQQTPTLGNDR